MHDISGDQAGMCPYTRIAEDAFRRLQECATERAEARLASGSQSNASQLHTLVSQYDAADAYLQSQASTSANGTPEAYMQLLSDETSLAAILFADEDNSTNLIGLSDSDTDSNEARAGSETAHRRGPDTPLPCSCEFCHQLYDGETLPFQYCRYCGDAPSHHHGRCCPQRPAYLYQLGMAARRQRSQDP